MVEDRDSPADSEGGGTEGETPVRRPRRWRWRHWLVGLFAALAVLLAGMLVWLDSPSGHRFVTRQIASLEPQSGLRIDIGRIEGSLYNRAVLHDVRLSDPKGVFLSAGTVRLHWWPVAWLSNRLEIDSLIVPTAHLRRLPQFRPSAQPRDRILPDFDIRIMRLEIGRLTVDRAVTGRADVFTVRGNADIRNGRAIVGLAARALQGGDRLRLALDSRPDDNRFDIDLVVNAPANGLIAKLAGLRQDANLSLDGDGDWRNWNGHLIATLSGKSAAGFRVQLRSGAYRIEGTLAGSAIASEGLLARLSSPQLAVRAEGSYRDKLLSGHWTAESDAIRLNLTGGIHLGGHGYDNLLIDVGLRRPQALLRNFDARGLIARVRLNGPFSSARFDYLLKADQLRFGTTVLHQVRAAGEGRLAVNGPTLIPIDLSAQRVVGQGDIAAAILSGARLTGMLQLRNGVVTSTPMKLRSQRVNAELVVLMDLSTGRYDVALSGTIDRLTIRGLGVVDVQSRLRAAPGARGGFTVTGRVAASMRRLDNGTLRTLAGGLPRMQADVALDANGRLTLSNILLQSPKLRFAGSAQRERNGAIRVTGSGRHANYGPYRFTMSGTLERPAVDIVLDRPVAAAGIADVHLRLTPETGGYAFDASGQSTLGAFQARGMIETPPGGQTALRIDSFTVNGAQAQGRLVLVEGGVTGRLLFSGSTHGTADFSVVGGRQQVDIGLRVENGHFAGTTPIDIRRGRLDAQISFGSGGTLVDATLTGRGLRYGGVRLNRFAANLQMRDGEGKLRASVVGQQARAFNLQIDADIAADTIGFDLGGTLDNRPISIDGRATLRRVEGGWALDPMTLRYGGGVARIDHAELGAETRIEGAMRDLPMSLLDLSNIDFGLSGRASGTLVYRHPRGGVPTGTLNLKATGLSRSGVTRTSLPVDLGLNAELTQSRLAMRAVIAREGKVIGRGQALLSPLGSGALIDRLRAAPVRAQLRYVGPAEALWRMSRVELVDMTGEAALSADVRGTGANPVIDGRLQTRNAALESPITGMRLSNLVSSGRFDGSKLVFSELRAATRNGGAVSGTGSFDFSLGQGVGIDLSFEARNAELLNRDDIGATVNGPIRIQSGGNGGTISGDFDVVRSRFMLGRAAAVAQIPQLQVIEKNSGRDQDFEKPVRALPWQLDIKANARNRLMVSGMGLASEWQMDLRIAGTVDRPVITGTADLVRGTYDFAGRRFDLTDGRLRFTGNVPTNPTLDITAQATVDDLNATIRITGTSEHPVISFSSTPSLPEDELLSRLLFGSSITQLSAPEALQLASAVASLRGGGGGGLDPINAVRKAAGLDRLRIVPADPVTGQGTSIAAGKYLTRRAYIEVVTDGQGYSATRLEYQIMRWLSLLSSISTLGRESVTVRVSKDY